MAIQLSGSINLVGSLTGSILADNGLVSSSQQITNYYKFAETASANTFYGIQTISGSFNVSGSTVQYGNNTLLGNTTLSGSIIISGSHLASTPTIKIHGDAETDGVIKFLPVSFDINNSISGSYIFVSGSTDDLYFSQNGAGYSNITRLRWLEGNLYTGLLHGGVISATNGGTTFNVSSGSGIIVSLNAATNRDPYPIINYVNWDNITNQSITYLTSSIQTFVAINSIGGVQQQTTAFNNGDYNTYITLGTVLHQNQSTVNATTTYPNVAFGYKQRTYDFIRAFGPLKLSGLSILTSGSLGLSVSSGTAFADGRNYQNNPNSPSYIIDTGTNVSKIFRYYESGSTFVQDTNSALGYIHLDPTQYNNNGTLTTVSGNNVNNYQWTIQRIFWYPNSATKGIVAYYGNAQYVSEDLAKVGLSAESFNEVENTKQNAVYLGAILLRKDAVFTDDTTYTIIPAGLFRSVSGGGAGGGSLIITDISSLNSKTGSYATTGSNTFIGTETISGSILLSGSLTINQNRIDDAWTAYTPQWTAASSNPVINNGTIQGYYKVVGKTCFVRGNIAMGSTTTFGTGEWYVSMPFTASHADGILMTATLLDNSTAWYNAILNGARAGFSHKSAVQYQTTGGTSDSLTPTTPFTWASGDRFTWNGSYEIT
jgi:hypothetical protein